MRHISLKFRMALFCKCTVNVLISFHWSLMLKMKELHRMIVFLYCFSNFLFQISHLEIVLSFLRWKGKSPHFSQYWKLFIIWIDQFEERLILLSLVKRSLVKRIMCNQWYPKDAIKYTKLERPVISRDWWVLQKQRCYLLWFL